MESPYFLLSHLVARYKTGDTSREEFLDFLDTFEEKLEDWFAELDSNPPPEDFPEGQNVVVVSQFGLFLFLKSIEALREFCHTGSDECIATALQRALAAHEHLREAESYSRWLLGNPEP